ncbi:hypothetical protein WMF45_31470 [Sorangium sp. So ce448]|uniref:hypothetical protein n=1 Tax=Sorangium sp. So ce448 TaxID=3133314 RepID=UPI003F5F8C0C
MGTALTVERYAEMRAQMEAGRLRDEVLARAGLTADEWTAAQREWLERMGAELERGCFELTNRYTQAFLDHLRVFVAASPPVSAPSGRAPAAPLPAAPAPRPAAPAPRPAAPAPRPAAPAAPAALAAPAARAAPAALAAPAGTAPLPDMPALVAALPFVPNAPPGRAPAARPPAAPAPRPAAPATPVAPATPAAPATPTALAAPAGTAPLPDMAALITALPFTPASEKRGAPAPPPPPSATAHTAPALSLEQYAALCAELSLHPRSAAALYPRYGLRDAAAWQATDAAWQARMRSDAVLEARWQQLIAHYRAHYRVR